MCWVWKNTENSQRITLNDVTDTVLNQNLADQGSVSLLPHHVDKRHLGIRKLQAGQFPSLYHRHDLLCLDTFLKHHTNFGHFLGYWLLFSSQSLASLLHGLLHLLQDNLVNDCSETKIFNHCHELCLSLLSHELREFASFHEVIRATSAFVFGRRTSFTHSSTNTSQMDPICPLSTTMDVNGTWAWGVFRFGKRPDSTRVANSSHLFDGFRGWPKLPGSVHNCLFHGLLASLNGANHRLQANLIITAVCSLLDQHLVDSGMAKAICHLQELGLVLWLLQGHKFILLDHRHQFINLHSFLEVKT
ncbi:hypothetical protein E2C01_036657 [Portunus trituberculatus]|uniref:Uncharacterized protein n=1 Tax=Portunus trituberculatus TaxID=210409 RepID=A0A5B7FD28_PORTR|nr:hypothetical protein [Portunus trituberculatus]